MTSKRWRRDKWKKTKKSRYFCAFLAFCHHLHEVQEGMTKIASCSCEPHLQAERWELYDWEEWTRWRGHVTWVTWVTWPGDAWKRPASLGNHPSWPIELWPEHLQRAQRKESKITEIHFFCMIPYLSFTALMPFIWRWSIEWIVRVIYYLVWDKHMSEGLWGEWGLKHENMWHRLRIHPPWSPDSLLARLWHFCRPSVRKNKTVL